MSAIVPRDIEKRLERRWSERLKQDESFQAKADRLKKSNPTVGEGSAPSEQMPRLSSEDETIIAPLPHDAD